jgi:opacity protein-like surface antigen
MKKFAFAAALLVLATAAATAASPSDAKQVKGQGCVQAGVEAGCLVVKDAQSGKLYSLLIKGAKPAIGAAIDFAGTPVSGTTACMQGTPVQLSTWSNNESLQCAKRKGKSVQ